MILSCCLLADAHFDKEFKELAAKAENFCNILPINHLNGKRISLFVEVNNIRFIMGKTFPQSQNSRMVMFEFVPRGDDEWMWKKLITVIAFIGYPNLTLEKWLSETKRHFVEKGQGIVIEETTTEFDNYAMASLCVRYKGNKNREELVYMRYYKGPYDGCCLQYAMPVDKNCDVQKIIQLMKNQLDQVGKIQNNP